MEESITIQEATTAVGVAGPSSYRPDASTRRYDRQLRLWARSGQAALENARVLLIHAGPTGTQALKNLVLPGIAQFCVLDPRTNASARDIGVNFFLEPESFGLPVAEETTRLLCELNPSVKGQHRVANPVELLRSDPSFFTSFTLVICCDSPDPSFVLSLSEMLWSADIPLILVRSSGFIGEMRLQYREHCVVDSHPDTTHTLRLDRPFEALRTYATGLDLEAMDSMEHSHAPYVVLLVRALETYKRENDGKSVDYESLEAFKEVLARERKQLDEENFEEAESQAFRVAQRSEVPEEVQRLFADPQCEKANKESKAFWLLVRALRDFTAGHGGGLLPLSSSLPDMKASTTSYIELQALYKQQAREDAKAFEACLAEVLAEVGLEGEEAIPKDEVEAFIKNCQGIACLKGRSWRQEIEEDPKREEILEAIESESTDIGHYISLRAVERFEGKHGGRFPSDEVELQEEVQALLKSYGREASGDLPGFLSNCIGETIRGAASSLPTVSAFLGGLVGQEAIKLITGQYIPLQSTVIADMVQSSLEKFSL